jgi:hypothetical protein
MRQLINGTLLSNPMQESEDAYNSVTRYVAKNNLLSIDQIESFGSLAVGRAAGNKTARDQWCDNFVSQQSICLMKLLMKMFCEQTPKEPSISDAMSRRVPGGTSPNLSGGKRDLKPLDFADQFPVFGYRKR